MFILTQYFNIDCFWIKYIIGLFYGDIILGESNLLTIFSSNCNIHCKIVSILKINTLIDKKLDLYIIIDINI